MGLFRKRETRPPGPTTHLGDETTGVMYGVSGVPWVTPMPAGPLPTGPVGGQVTLWAPLPGYVSEQQQKGAFAGRLLNQFPAKVDGVQLQNGRLNNNPGWNTPGVTFSPTGYGTPTTQQNNLPGGQRVGQRYGGGIGPISARRNMQAVIAAQIRQSGASALKWAEGLSPQ